MLYVHLHLFWKRPHVDKEFSIWWFSILADIFYSNIISVFDESLAMKQMISLTTRDYHFFIIDELALAIKTDISEIKVILKVSPDETKFYTS